jgi:hypothetical protein
MATDPTLGVRADVTVIESDDGLTFFACCERCTHVVRTSTAFPAVFADAIVEHQWAAHHRAWIGIRFDGNDSVHLA